MNVVIGQPKVGALEVIEDMHAPKPEGLVTSRKRLETIDLFALRKKASLNPIQRQGDYDRKRQH